MSAHWPKEPIARLRSYLQRQGHWSKEQEEALLQECQRRVEEAAESYLLTPPLSAAAMFMPREAALTLARSRVGGP